MGIDTASVKMSMNPFCEIAVEEELRLREAGAASEDIAAQSVPRRPPTCSAPRSPWVPTAPSTSSTTPAPPARSSRSPSPRSSVPSRSRRPPASSSSASRMLPPGEVAHRSARGFVSEDEFLSIPEFSTNRLSQRLLHMVDGLNFKEFISFLSTFSARASLQQKIELIFKVYGIDGKGKVSFKDLGEVSRDLTGSSMSEKQREVRLTFPLLPADALLLQTEMKRQ
ncbi:uncharacterized protein LOC119291457 [Triticum dicoccoides]|uniref:uncharacterized protein LOC119291457 n=1 Tax=Triticum dicoccoides TaxID=85692 RepID=UPI0018907C9A|nr:uncharacterized protein LOC119291457 [Triticum dicoccoides]XP_037426109.1 uncharacterized protein LOC119291457 [Triticum dicoccoides]